MRPGSRNAVLGPIDRLFRTGTAVGLSDAQLLERFVLGHDEGAESAFNVLGGTSRANGSGGLPPRS